MTRSPTSVRSTRRLLNIAYAILLIPALAAGQGRPTADVGVYDLSLEDLLNLEVDTVSRRLQPLALAPARSVVVTRTQIKQRNYRNLRDLLQDMPEIDVLNNHSSITRSVASVRGLMGNNRFLVLLDGVRVSSMTGDEAPVEDNYPLFDADRVEIIYGPASALYGHDALMGVINIVSRPVGAGVGASAMVSYGTQDSRYVAARAFAPVGDTAHLSLTAHLQSSDGADLPSAYPEDFQNLGELREPFSGATLAEVSRERFSDRTSSHSLSARLTMGAELTLGFDLRQFTQLTAVGTRPEFTQYEAEAPHRWTSAYLVYRKNLLPALRSESELIYSTYSKLPTYSYNNAFSGFASQFKFSENQTFSLRQQLSYVLTESVDLVGGITWANVHAAPETGGFEGGPLDPDLPPASQGRSIPGTSIPFPFYELNYRQLGAYLQAQAQLLPALSVTAGLRFDHDTRYGGTLNPRLGAVYQFAEGNALKLLYGEAFLAPPPAYQYAFWGSFAGTDPATGRPFSYYFHVPNPDLTPLKGRTLETNYSWLPTKELLFEAAAYVTALEGMITSQISSEPTTFADADIYTAETFQSNGEGLLYGGSVALKYQARLGSLGLDPWVSFSYAGGRTLENEDLGWVESAHVVPYKVKGGLTVRYGAFSFTPRVRWASRSTHSSLQAWNPTRRVTVPASTVIDASLRAEDVLIPGLELAVHVRNLLDARYYQPGGIGQLEFVQSPQDPRSGMLELSYSFE